MPLIAVLTVGALLGTAFTSHRRGNKRLRNIAIVLLIILVAVFGFRFVDQPQFV